MNYKSLLLSLILTTGVWGNCFPMQKNFTHWFSKVNLSEMVQKVTQSDAYHWMDQYKAPLLVGAAALIAAGAAYKYFWKKAEQTNEQIKARIKKETFNQLIEYEKKMMQKRDELLDEIQTKKEELLRQQRKINEILSRPSRSLEVHEELDNQAKTICTEMQKIEKSIKNQSYNRMIIEPQYTRRISQPLIQTDYRLIVRPLIHRTSNDLLGVEAEYYYYCDKSKEIVELPFAIPQEVEK